MPGSYDLQLYRGDTGRWQFMLWQDDLKTVPVDLSGASVSAQIRNAPGGSVIVSMSCAVTEPNRVDMVLSAADSAGVSLSRGVWDLQVTYASGDVSTVLAGRTCVTADVTQVAA